jgi:hypothetical protein
MSGNVTLEEIAIIITYVIFETIKEEEVNVALRIDFINYLFDSIFHTFDNSYIRMDNG